MEKKRLIIGMTGATGQIYGVRMLEILKEIEDVETHLIMSDWSRKTLAIETDFDCEYVEGLADYVYGFNDLEAPISSGSFQCFGMIILPCSIKTMSAIANSFSINLIIRAADVTLKERRPLVLCVRECPLHLGHLRLMSQVAEIGAIIFPPVPSYYSRPQTIDDIVTQTVCRTLEQCGIKSGFIKRWGDM